MPKVGPVPMLMSETGNQAKGFTLLEIVAVITLIGLIMFLAYPRINFSVERVEIGYIGRLIKTDFNQIKDESLSDPGGEMIVTFAPSGYFFQIGEHTITRSFKYQFAFDLPKSIEDPNDSAGAEKSESDPLATTPDKVAHTPTPSVAKPTDNSAAKDDQENNNNNMETKVEYVDMKVKNGELDQDVQLNWQTTHFQGSLLLQKNGTVKWSYGKK
jgi:prepilin-type N-terminal cleavage/methylation domain-containing protein